MRLSQHGALRTQVVEVRIRVLDEPFVSEEIHSVELAHTSHLGCFAEAAQLASYPSMIMPPSTTRTWPVIMSLSSEARNTAVPVRSWGWRAPFKALNMGSM